MQYSVIYSFDCNASVSQYRPPQHRKWELTECGPSEYFDKGKHRKYCALLTQKQFDKFVESCGLFCDRIHTMGSLGAPGFGLGWSPAVSFRSEEYNAYQNAYVTPVGSKKEIVLFLRENKQEVPQILLDAKGQKYLFNGIEEAENYSIWDALELTMWKKYG